MTGQEKDRISKVAAKIEAMAAAINGLKELDESTLDGIWHILKESAQELNILAD